MLQDHLMESIEQKRGNSDVITQILPAIQVFVQSVRLCAPGLVAHKRIDLAVDAATLLHIIDLTSVSATSGCESQTRMLRQFVVLLLCPPAPFINTLANPVSLANDLLETKRVDPINAQQRQLLAGVLAASKSEIA
jgi:hypothetical protein